MAKDAKGHGSDKRGDGGGGKTPVQSENAPFQSRLGAGAGHSYLDPNDPRGAGKSDAAAKAELGGGHPKSGDVPVHSSLSENIAAFKAKYGGPRDHAREQRSFNRGKREINRLRKQGK